MWNGHDKQGSMEAPESKQRRGSSGPLARSGLPVYPNKWECVAFMSVHGLQFRRLLGVPPQGSPESEAGSGSQSGSGSKHTRGRGNLGGS